MCHLCGNTNVEDPVVPVEDFVYYQSDSCFNRLRMTCDTYRSIFIDDL